jgi:hypothetical protein
MAKKRRPKDDLKEIDVLLERLREFVRLNYMTAAEVARQIGVNDTTVYSWLLGQARSAEPKRITTFLDSLPREKWIRHGSNGDINIANTRTGAVSQSLAVARSVSRRRAWFEEAAAGLQAFVQIVMRMDRSGRATMRRCGPGTGGGKIDLNNDSPIVYR